MPYSPATLAGVVRICPRIPVELDKLVRYN